MDRKKMPAPLAIITAGLLLTSTAHAERIPNLWGPKVVSPESLHLREQPLTEESFRYVSLHPVLFDSGKATISAEGHKALDAAADYLLKNGSIKRILIEGNTDYAGNERYNDNLSDRRSAMVRNYLTLKGVSPDLMVLSGNGEHDPVDLNWTRSGRQRNRHVAIYVVHWQQQMPEVQMSEESQALPPPPELPESAATADVPLDWQQSSFGR